jgi:hypothetical protein
MPDYQRRMKERRGRSNPEKVFGVMALPSDTWIREQLDRISPEQYSGIFTSIMEIAEGAG